MSQNVVATTATAALYAALVAAQAEFFPVAKSAVGQSGTKSFQFADLASVINATRPALSKHGLAVLQPLRATENGHELVTILIHRDGGSLEYAIPLPQDIVSMQDFGAVVTYLRRYAYKALLCIADADEFDIGSFHGPVPPTSVKPAKKGKRSDLPALTYEDFWEQSEGWRQLVMEGTDPADIIAMASTKWQLSEEQEERILRMGGK